MWTGELSLRRLRVLICELPHTSRLSVAMRGGTEFEGWDLHAYLLAALVDAVQANTHAVVQVQSSRRIKAPAPLPRPGNSGRGMRGRVVRVADLPGARDTAASSERPALSPQIAGAAGIAGKLLDAFVASSA